MRDRRNTDERAKRSGIKIEKNWANNGAENVTLRDVTLCYAMLLVLPYAEPNIESGTRLGNFQCITPPSCVVVQYKEVVLTVICSKPLSNLKS